MSHPAPLPLAIALLTISDTRSEADDRSGAWLSAAVTQAGHNVAARRLVPDDIYQIRAVVSAWLIDPKVHVIVTTGGTGVTGRDGTPEAVRPLLDKVLDGFGELFRWLSYEEIGASSLQSRALAGVANGRFVFCLPGSTGACRLAWERLIQPQLHSATEPCNLAQLLSRLNE